MSIRVEIRRYGDAIELIAWKGEKGYSDVYSEDIPIGEALTQFEAFINMVEYREKTPDWFERGKWLNVEQEVSHGTS